MIMLILTFLMAILAPTAGVAAERSLSPVPADACAAVVTELSLRKLTEQFLHHDAEFVFNHAPNIQQYIGERITAGHISPAGTPSGSHARVVLAPELVQETFAAYFWKFLSSDFMRQDSWLNGINIRPSQLFPADPTADRAFAVHKIFVERRILPNNAQVYMMGDLHGSMHSLLRNLWSMVRDGVLGEDFKLSDTQKHLVFLGDFVDRGLYGIEVVYLIMRLKLANWDNVHLVRGNHEDGCASKIYGFWDELDIKYGNTLATELYASFNKLSNTLPYAIFFGTDDTVQDKRVFFQCSHGGIEPFHDPRKLMQAADGVCYEYIPNVLEAMYPCACDFPHGKKFKKTADCWHMLRSGSDGQLLNADHARTLGFMYERNHIPGHGYMWSDYSRAEHSAFLLCDGVERWVLNAARGGAGFAASLSEIEGHLQKHELVAIFRGHQDMHSCFMLPVPATPKSPCGHGYNPGPWDWRFYPGMPAGLHAYPELLAERGIRFASLPPFITFSTAGEGRANWAEGYGILQLTPDYRSWKLYVCERLLVEHAPGSPHGLCERRDLQFRAITRDALRGPVLGKHMPYEQLVAPADALGVSCVLGSAGEPFDFGYKPAQAPAVPVTLGCSGGGSDREIVDLMRGWSLSTGVDDRGASKLADKPAYCAPIARPIARKPSGGFMPVTLADSDVNDAVEKDTPDWATGDDDREDDL